ncbi:MAG: heme exporter protein CcmB [Candidatus Lindowbacteria bacterium]|nr:heme exporter protein CcmB [Candidatus Lindowbacteria bacterium]
MNIIFAFLKKDLLRELRTGEIIFGATAFAFAVVLIYAFSLPLERLTQFQASAAFWIAILFSSQIGISRGVEIDRTQGRLDAIRSTGIDPTLFFISKTVSLFILLGFMSLLILSTTFFLFNLEFKYFFRMLPFVALGVMGLSFSGPVIAFLAAGSRIKDILTPLFHLILFVPLLIACVMATNELFLVSETNQNALWSTPAKMLMAYDLILGGTVLFLAPNIIED